MLNFRDEGRKRTPVSPSLQRQLIDPRSPKPDDLETAPQKTEIDSHFVITGSSADVYKY
jgi:hypothetical protein